jgi:hypothetical protein
VVFGWDLETTHLDVQKAEVAEVHVEFFRVERVGEAQKLELTDMGLAVSTFVRPSNGMFTNFFCLSMECCISGCAVGMSTDFLREHGISDEQLASAPGFLEVVDGRLLPAISMASHQAGQVEGHRRVFGLGHNSNLYDNRVMHFQLERLTGEPGGWARRLAEAGVVGMFDSLNFLAAPWSALASEGFNGRNGNLEAVYGKVIGGKLEPAHRAGGDVKGLMRIVRECESMKACLMVKISGVALSDWVKHTQLLIEKAAIKRAAERAYPVPPAPPIIILAADGAAAAAVPMGEPDP